VTKIYYFSGTGNTLWSAKQIAAALRETGNSVELRTIGAEAQNEKIVIEADAVVLLFPSYAYGLPLAVHRFAVNAEFNTPYIAALVTFGSSPGGTLAEMGRILKRKKVRSCWFGRIPAVENYIAIFGPQSAETIQRRTTLQKEATAAAARALLARQTNRINTFRPLSGFVSLLFSLGVKIFYKRYRVSADCSGCGICEKVCPAGAVTMRPFTTSAGTAGSGNRPMFSNKCEHCQGCLNWCPQKAIHFGRLNAVTPRYHHPEIGFAEMRQSTTGMAGTAPAQNRVY
jgi:ferredoxin